MEAHDNREAFIPYRRSDIIKLCLDDGQLNTADTEKFQDFCEILSSFYHFRFHKTLEIIKENYAPFNPNTDVEALVPPKREQYEEMESKVIDGFEHIMERANYIKLPESVVKEALDQESLIQLKTEVDFDDFERIICYYRGSSDQTVSVNKLFFWKQKKKIDFFERIVILIKFKDEDYFHTKDKNIEELKFIPGKMYVYFYKNIPQLDIDLLFPNVHTSMTWKDRLLFGIPAIGGAIPLILKALPNLLLLVAAILLAVNAEPLVEQLEVEPYKVRNIMPVLVATLSLGMALGGFAFKQYSNYKTKKLKFQKDVTETLFFKNLGNNDSVFQMFIDLAEEEECKEIILVYYHLLTSNNPLTPQELDARIETWMEKKLGTKINFDIDGPLNNLANICGKLTTNNLADENSSEIPLLSYDNSGNCKVVPLNDGKKIIDYVWDNTFSYNQISL